MSQIIEKRRMTIEQVKHLLKTKNKTIGIYVMEGIEEGWHEFDSYNKAVEYAEHLLKADYEFVCNPNW
jgi:predicted DNA-binding protein